MNEESALRSLITPGASREAVTCLGIDLLSPWSSTRHEVRDRPDRGVGGTSALTSFSGTSNHCWAHPLPTDHGVLAWAKWHRVMLPLADIPSGPNWIRDDALAAAWIALPPTDGYPPDLTGEILKVDGRIVALYLLAHSADRAVVRVLAEWILGSRSSDVEARADQADALAFPNRARRYWTRTVRALPVEPVVDLVMGPDLVSAGWTPPPPTAAEIAAEEERQRILAEGEAHRQERIARGAERVGAR